MNDSEDSFPTTTAMPRSWAELNLPVAHGRNASSRFQNTVSTCIDKVSGGVRSKSELNNLIDAQLSWASGVRLNILTLRAHPVSAAAALKNIEIIEREELIQNAATVGEYFQAELRSAVVDNPLVGDVRGLGMIAGVELVADKKAKKPFELSQGVARKMYTQLLKQGLVCRPILNMLAFSPPLILSEADVDAIIGRFTNALEDLNKDLGR